MTYPYVIPPWEDRPGAYAGVGSRGTPADVLKLMASCARALATRGWAVRSGGAEGADTAFQMGVLTSPEPERFEIYLPWEGFNDHREGPSKLRLVSDRAWQIAREHHPKPRALSHGGRLLMARNVHQILGASLSDPVRFVLCWTPDGAFRGEQTSIRTGGTGQAIRIASAFGVPVYNLALDSHRAMWSELA